MRENARTSFFFLHFVAVAVGACIHWLHMRVSMSVNVSREWQHVKEDKEGRITYACMLSGAWGSRCDPLTTTHWRYS